jgi:hypothetical protein
MGRDSRASTTLYRVTFSRGPQAFTAAIRSGAEGATVRFLDAREPNCAALAHATAIALAVLFDADLGGESTPEEKTPAPTPPPPVTPPVAKPPPAVDVPRARNSPSGARVEPLFSLGAAALVGVLRPVAPAFVADAGVELGSVRMTVGALLVAPQTIELARGSAREKLLSANLRLCYALLGRNALRLELCSGVLVGQATAEARDFYRNERHSELFLAFPAELALSGRSGFIGWQVGASALVPVPPNEFEVKNLGPVYEPPAIAGLFALRVFFEPLR